MNLNQVQDMTNGIKQVIDTPLALRKMFELKKKIGEISLFHQRRNFKGSHLG